MTRLHRTSIAMTAPTPRLKGGPASRRLPAPGNECQTSMPPELVGPMTIPAGLRHALHTLVSSAGADEFASLFICATVLARRLSPPGAERRVRVIQGSREAITPALATPVDLADGFRTALRRAGELGDGTVPEETTGQRPDVTILVTEDSRRLVAESMSSSADGPAALCWARSFVQLLTGLVSQPDAPVAAHPLISDADRGRILHGLNPSRCPEIRNHTMTEPFEEQAERCPGAIALIDENGVMLTYRELNERANRLAHFLRDDGAGPDTRVGICLQRSIHQIVAIYATVKAGATYVPLDTELPDVRLGYMLGDCAPLHVLTDPACRDRIPDGPWRVVDVAADCTAWDVFPATTPAVAGCSSCTRLGRRAAPRVSSIRPREPWRTCPGCRASTRTANRTQQYSRHPPASTYPFGRYSGRCITARVW